MTPRTTPQRSPSRRRARSGVSLLEVLFSIGILMVGLLGVVSVIPAGRLEMVEAGKADRASACAQAVLRDVKIRGLLNPRMWRYEDGSYVVTVSGGRTLLRCRTYAIDPLFVAHNQGNANVRKFPFLGATTQMERITLAQRPGTNTILPLSEAERLCTWNDDLLFADPDDSDDRPRQTFVTDASATPVRWPIRTTDGVTGSPQAILPANKSDFSWLFTVTPIGPMVWRDLDAGTAGNEAYVDVDQPLSYEVSVVVFFRRDRGLDTSTDETPSERAIAEIHFLDGLGGGDASLTDPTASFLAVKAKDWLMAPMVASGAAANIPTPFAWYRVVATDEGPVPSGTSWTRQITVEGPDYPYGPNVAALFSNVVSVFRTMVQSEGKD